MKLEGNIQEDETSRQLSTLRVSSVKSHTPTHEPPLRKRMRQSRTNTRSWQGACIQACDDAPREVECNGPSLHVSHRCSADRAAVLDSFAPPPE
jgi:hypothetical protein